MVEILSVQDWFVSLCFSDSACQASVTLQHAGNANTAVMAKLGSSEVQLISAKEDSADMGANITPYATAMWVDKSGEEFAYDEASIDDAATGIRVQGFKPLIGALDGQWGHRQNHDMLCVLRYPNTCDAPPTDVLH